MLLSSLSSGAPAAITSLSAPIFGILGLAGFAIFAIGGKRDNDGQGTNSSPYIVNNQVKKNLNSDTTASS